MMMLLIFSTLIGADIRLPERMYGDLYIVAEYNGAYYHLDNQGVIVNDGKSVTDFTPYKSGLHQQGIVYSDSKELDVDPNMKVWVGVTPFGVSPFDELTYVSDVPWSLNNAIIYQPLKSGASTALPGCMFAHPLVHVRQCGEVNPDVMVNEQIYSMEFVNTDVDRFSLVTDNILPHDVLFNTEILFNVSISEIAGDIDVECSLPAHRSPTLTLSQCDLEDGKTYYFNVQGLFDSDSVKVEVYKL